MSTLLRRNQAQYFFAILESATKEEQCYLFPIVQLEQSLRCRLISLQALLTKTFFQHLHLHSHLQTKNLQPHQALKTSIFQSATLRADFKSLRDYVRNDTLQNHHVLLIHHTRGLRTCNSRPISHDHELTYPLRKILSRQLTVDCRWLGLPLQATHWGV